MLTVKHENKTYKGFTSISVDLSLTRLCNTFSISMPYIPSFPIVLRKVIVILANDQPILTGFVEATDVEISDSGRTITMTGRSLLADVVDSSIGCHRIDVSEKEKSEVSKQAEFAYGRFSALGQLLVNPIDSIVELFKDGEDALAEQQARNDQLNKQSEVGETVVDFIRRIVAQSPSGKLVRVRDLIGDSLEPLTAKELEDISSTDPSKQLGSVLQDLANRKFIHLVDLGDGRITIFKPRRHTMYPTLTSKDLVKRSIKLDDKDRYGQYEAVSGNAVSSSEEAENAKEIREILADKDGIYANDKKVQENAIKAIQGGSLNPTIQIDNDIRSTKCLILKLGEDEDDRTLRQKTIETMNLRRARGMSATITVASHRYLLGEPIRIEDPLSSLSGEYLIEKVSYIQDSNGYHSELTLCDPLCYTTEKMDLYQDSARARMYMGLVVLNENIDNPKLKGLLADNYAKAAFGTMYNEQRPFWEWDPNSDRKTAPFILDQLYASALGNKYAREPNYELLFGGKEPLQVLVDNAYYFQESATRQGPEFLREWLAMCDELENHVAYFQIKRRKQEERIAEDIRYEEEKNLYASPEYGDIWDSGRKYLAMGLSQSTKDRIEAKRED